MSDQLPETVLGLLVVEIILEGIASSHLQISVDRAGLSDLHRIHPDATPPGIGLPSATVTKKPGSYGDWTKGELGQDPDGERQETQHGLG